MFNAGKMPYFIEADDLRAAFDETTAVREMVEAIIAQTDGLSAGPISVGAASLLGPDPVQNLIVHTASISSVLMGPHK